MATTNKVLRSEARNKKLSPRQREVLLLMKKGMRNNEIAETLDLDSRTVSTVVVRIYKKYGIDAKKNTYYLIDTLDKRGVLDL